MVEQESSRRRLVIALGAAALLPNLARAQGKLARVGFLGARTREEAVEVAPFLEGMRALGYVEGKNIQYEWRFGGGNYDRLDELAAELVGLKVDVIVAVATPSARAAHRATKSIPIVMTSVNDPVRLGLAKSIARPGGNVTGLINLDSDMRSKQTDLLLKTLPKLSRLGVLFNPGNPGVEVDLEQVRAAAKGRGVQVSVFRASDSSAIEQAFVAVKRERVEALLVMGDAFFMQRRSQLAALTAKA